MTTLLQPYIPGLVQDLVAAFVANGRATIPAGRRDEVVRMLNSVVDSTSTVTEYAAVLAAALPAGVVTPEAPNDLPLESFYREGLRVLSDDQLARLALNTDAIGELCDRLDSDDVLCREKIGLWILDAGADIHWPPDVAASYEAATARAVAEFLDMERRTRPNREGEKTEDDE